MSMRAEAPFLGPVRRLVVDVATRIREAAANREARRIARLKAQFDQDQALYNESGIHQILDELLREPDFVNETQAKRSVPVWTPAAYSSETPVFYALARWNRVDLTGVGQSVVNPDYRLAETWKEIKVFVDARRQTITINAGINRCLVAEVWNQKDVLARLCQDARDNPAPMATPEIYFNFGTQHRSNSPMWGGLKLSSSNSL